MPSPSLFSPPKQLLALLTLLSCFLSLPPSAPPGIVNWKGKGEEGGAKRRMIPLSCGEREGGTDRVVVDSKWCKLAKEEEEGRNKVAHGGPPNERKKERGRRPCWLQNGERRKRRKQSTLHGEEWESLELLLLSYFSSSFWSSFHGPNYCSIGWVVWSSSDPNNFTPGFCGMLYLWFDRSKEITGGFRDSVPMHAKV